MCAISGAPTKSTPSIWVLKHLMRRIGKDEFITKLTEGILRNEVNAQPLFTKSASRHHYISLHLPSKTEDEKYTIRHVFHYWDWSLCRGPSAPWHVGASTLLSHQWFSCVYGIHEFEPMTSVTYFSWLDREQPSQPSPLSQSLFSFQPRY